MNTDVAIVILAAGDGTRMKSNLPKVMHPLHGRPLIDYVVSAAEACDVGKPIVVVSPKHTLVQDFLGDRAVYAVQQEQLGTGHAVQSARDAVSDTVQTVLVVYADLPFLRTDSMLQIITEHQLQQATISMLTTTVPSFDDAWAPMYSFGRIIRDPDGDVLSITEMKDATEAERNIRELNTGLYCYDAAWLWDHLNLLSNNNAQQEYYLTDLVAMAMHEGQLIATADLNPQESFGISTQADLQTAENKKMV